MITRLVISFHATFVQCSLHLDRHYTAHDLSRSPWKAPEVRKDCDPRSVCVPRLSAGGVALPVAESLK